MRMLAFSCLALLVGCQTVPLEERARNTSHAELCAAVFYAPPHVAGVALNEARNRGIDCNNFRQEAAMAWATYQQQEAAKTQALNDMARRFQPRPSVVCTTNPWGDGARTVCR